MTLLVISPDYASHLLPLATLAGAWKQAGDRVVVATGPATADIVASFGFEQCGLQLGRGSNPGVIRVQDQPVGEDESLRGFFAATHRGMIATLKYQAQARTVDLLWNPVVTARRVLDIVDQIRPTEIIVDHLAFSARLALDSAQISYGDVVLGHPTALPIGDEVYGYPASWPRCFEPDVDGLADLLTTCRAVRDTFTAEWNAATAALGSNRPPVADAFAACGDLLLLNYPGRLHGRARTAQLPPHVFLGSAIRAEEVDESVQRWLRSSRQPIVYVSFGSFLSARADVLAKVVAALRGLDVRVALAIGSADPAALGELPAGWLVREFLPQVTIVEQAALLVTHAGNNSVTEAAALGVPMVLLPFSTDQFAGAAAVESAGLGTALDPNAATSAELRVAINTALGSAMADRARTLGVALRAAPGPELAYRRMVG